MDTMSPRQICSLKVEPRSRRLAAHTDVLCEIAAATLTENVGVVCRGDDGDGFGGDLILVAESVGDLLQFIPREPNAVMDDDVMRRSGLIVGSVVLLDERW